MNKPVPVSNLPARRTADLSLSIVVPLFNEQEVLPALHQRLRSALEGMPGDTGLKAWEILYVNDGSSDASLEVIARIQNEDPAVSLLSFSRNFGKEQAISAGLQHARGDAVVVIDADLQDPPELIADMVRAWREGADVVNMRRLSRDGETWFKRATAHAFYRVMERLSEVPIPADVGDFRLLSRRAVDALNLLPERNRFMKGLFAWIGYRQVTLDYHRHARAAGQSKWPYWRLWNFALEGITGFSTLPLKLASYIGVLAAVAAFLYALYFLIKTLLLGEVVAGFPTLIVTLLFMGGLQLMALGVIGEYLARLVTESKQRPLYLIDTYRPGTSLEESASGEK